jgi:excisionase family DNA binding protein
MPWGSYVRSSKRIIRVTKVIPDVTSRYYTVRQVASALSVTPSTVRRWLQDGLFPADGVLQPRGPGKRTLVSRDAFEAFCAGQPARLGRAAP